MARSTTEQREHFQALIRKAEKLVAENPAAYRQRIILLALLGYGVLFGVLFLLLALIVGSVWAALASSAFLLLLLKKKLIFLLGYMVYVIGRSLWVKIEPPQGYELEIKRYPELAQVLAELRTSLDTPRIHRVILTDELNAGISQTPRLGVFGWQRNTLILGLQLLLALSPEQAKAVLAHEFGHLSGNHSRFSAWIYRVRQTWYRVMTSFDEAGHWATRGLARFFDWYAPHFNAYSFALARANEYEADALSAQLTSKEAAATALVTTHVGSDLLGRTYWRPFIARADLEPQANGTPFRGMAGFLREMPVDEQPLREELGKALGQETGSADTHPALKDRLAALGVPPPLPQPITRSAAQAWLGEQYEQVVADFDRDWLQRNGDAWAERYQAAQEIRDKLAALNAKPEEELSQEECWQRAAWTEQQDQDALPLYRAYAKRYPDDADADLAIGRLLLNADDPAGMVHIEHAAEHFPLTLAACETAYAYYLRTGDRQQADRWLLRGEAQIDLENKARQERASVTPKDKLEASTLDNEQLAELAGQLNKMGGIKHAWICRKTVEIRPDAPVYVLAFQAKGWFPKESKLVDTLAQDLEGPGLTFIVMKGGQTRKLAKRVIKLGQQVM